MYCEKCGNQIDDNAIVCPNCGCATSNYKTNNTIVQTQVTKDYDSIRSTAVVGIVIGLFIPLIGLICGIVALSKLGSKPDTKEHTKEYENAKNLGQMAIVIPLTLWILIGIIALIVAYMSSCGF